MSFQYREKKDSGPRTNEQITASEVRVISSSGKQLGIISIREALNHAEDEGFDLVEVAPPYDHADVTSLAGASIVLEFLYILGHQKQR